MKLPLSLIKSYIHLEEPLSVLCETLTLLGIEVDGILNERPRFANIVAATVLETAPHPHADKLRIALVHDGINTVQVVCGAENCRPGIKTAFAKAGVGILFDQDGKECKILQTEIRKIASHGMLCSAEELGIPQGTNGILELPGNTPDGQNLENLLWDPVLELSMTPNLGHCMSALGIARELSAALQRPLHRPKISLRETPLQQPFEIAIHDPDLCSRYACKFIGQVRVAPSPFWLQQTLLAMGHHPINNIVDVTNYILFKTGQPLHAFDAKKIEGKTLSVQTSETPQVFLGLNKESYRIEPGALLICDEHKTLAIAGVSGGCDSAGDDATDSVLLEAAYFDPVSIRKTARALALRTESSQRFEKGVDPEGLEAALNEASSLILELAQGQIAQGIVLKTGKPLKSKEIKLRPERVNHLLGTHLSFGEIESILHRIGCKTHITDQTLHTSIPSFRGDLFEEIDLVEEVARIYGYNKIERTRPRISISQIPHDPLYLFEKQLRSRLIALHLQELLTCDLISPRQAELYQEGKGRRDNSSVCKVLHAKTEEYSMLRPSLLPGVLEVVHTNVSQNNASLHAFELGKVYIKNEQKYVETPMLALVLYGEATPKQWSQKARDVDFYDLKGFLETLFEGLRLPKISYKTSREHPSFHPGRQATIHLDGLLIGTFGELHPTLLAKLPIKERVFYAEISLSSLMQSRIPPLRMTRIAEFPSTERDWTVTLPPSFEIATLFEAVRNFQNPLLAHATLIDLYTFDDNGETKRNATFRFTYRDLIKTVSFEEAQAVHERLLEQLLLYLTNGASPQTPPKG